MKTKPLAICAILGGLALSATAQEQTKNAFAQPVPSKPYLEPSIARPEQEKVAAGKLAALEKRFGRKPNILIVLVDDMGWGDPGCFGGGLLIGAPTPNIDKLATGGLKLLSVYSQPTCTPSRAALMTGRIPTRSGLTRPTLSGEVPKVNPWADEVTAAKLLSGSGYRTALSGKWHLGEGEGSYPHQCGYDEYYGILSVMSDFSQQLDKRLYPDLILRPDRLAALQKLSEAAITKGSKGGPLEVSEEIKSTEDLAQIDQKFADFSEDFIRRTTKENKPFYLCHSFGRLHNDSYPAKGYEGKSPAGFPQRDALVETDDIVARLINVLKETGQLENTLVFFTSDNGGNEDLMPDSSYQPFRGGKGTTWEGGVRVPGIAYWPGMIAPGRVDDGLFDLCDLFNTPLAIAGITDKIPSERFIDGIDQTSYLLADDGKSKRDAVFMYAENTLTAVRWLEYKVHFKVFLNQSAHRNLDESTLNNLGMAPWVYNLYMDPKEQSSQGHSRFEWGLPQAMMRAGRHGATFEKYPRKDIGLRKPGE
ncbi:arylsulfatase [Luteolibacter yonseiensis]|uniref:Arylsulfatase n=1 Tax=Luteolibacter yonseiensis TaxID=1144680 RepID=A0A934VBQ5_9BACT|nr:arylsulfatase [Luteolibacter yonseiensis]MBK1816186.1 arylsulfatase [Luteolibacter yonseiensis]